MQATAAAERPACGKLVPMSDASPSQPAIRRLHRVSDADVEALAALMVDVVEGGASIGFMLPIDAARAAAFWRRVGAGVADGDRVLFVAHDGDGIVGTVQLVLEQPENQPHRADVAKMMVANRARRQGIGAALMQAAEHEAKARGKTLLVLDTASADAERLYDRMGWRRVGVIPNYALWPDGGLVHTTVYYKDLAGGS